MGFIPYLILAVLVGAVAFAATRPSRQKRVLLIILAVLTNLGAFILLAPAYLVSRLDGSSPPTLGEFLAPYSIFVLLLMAVNVLMIYLYQREP
jgi:hypothetical protein